MKKDTCIIVGPQALPTLLKSIAYRKGAYPNLIVHSPKRPWRTQGELMDVTNPSICQQSPPSDTLGVRIGDLRSETTCRTLGATNSPRSNCL